MGENCVCHDSRVAGIREIIYKAEELLGPSEGSEAARMSVYRILDSAQTEEWEYSPLEIPALSQDN